MRLAMLCLTLLGSFFLAAPAADAPHIGTIPVNVSTQPPRSAEEERRSFHLPPGFEIQLVAAEPYVRKPINMNFDDRGRLWVTESVEYPFPAPPNKPHRDAVKIYTIDPKTGHAADVKTFTTGLNIPIGVLPITGGAIVYSIPNIYRYNDINGDDRADSHQYLYGTIGYKDTHGMTGNFIKGFDGWIYACHGYANDSTVKGADGHAVHMNSGNTYRFRPDGSHVEYFTHGQVNPFGLAFDPLGNLFASDCETKPIYQLLRGAYYPSFGKPDDGLGFAPEVMTHNHGSTAIAGITYYAADQFPPEFRGNIFVGNVVTNRINRDRLEWHGSTPRALEMPDLVISDDPWFRPVNLKLGPDGALYVADFYNSIIGHYEVPLTHPGRDHAHGRIWRIVYRGTDGKTPPPHQPRADWAMATVPQLLSDLAHPNLVVRMKAMNQLVERGGKDAVRGAHELLWQPLSNYQRMHSVWILARMGALDEATIEHAAHDLDRGVRTHLMRVLAERQPWTAREHEIALAGLRDSDAFVRRTAADALGMHPDPANIRALLDLREHTAADDNHAIHTVRMALRNQLVPPDSWKHLPEKLSEQDIRAIADAAPGAHRPEAASYLLQHLETMPESPENQLRYVKHIARFGGNDLTDRLMRYVRHNKTGGLLHAVALFRVVQEGTQARGVALAGPAREWAKDLARELIASTKEPEVLAGIELCGSLKMRSAQGLLRDLVLNGKASETQRGDAMGALVAIDPAGQVSLLGQLLADASQPLPVREKAAGQLGAINQPTARAELLRTLPTASERLSLVIAAHLASNRDGGEKLLETITAGKASARLLRERIVEIGLERSGVPDFRARIEKLTSGLPQADTRVDELIKKRREAFLHMPHTNLALGRALFEKNCSICHRLNNVGAKVGPTLDGIGNRGLERLLEDVLDPNRIVDQAFRTTTLTLKSGRLLTGLLLREEGAVLVLADNQGKEVRVPKADVEDRIVSQMSLMPANFGDQIPEADFCQLLAYLLEQRVDHTAPPPGTALKAH